jgi:DNA replication initiation complex subunit (GINS family)
VADNNVTPIQPKQAVLEDEERVFKLHGMIEAERMRLKKAKGTPDASKIYDIVTGTVMPLLAELAHYAAEQATMTYELAEKVEGDGPQDTQFTPDDAKKFELIVTYALGVASESLKQLDSGTADHQKAVELVNTANECLQIIEDGTLVDGPPDDGDEEPDEPSN